MKTWIALLRGINVGGNNLLPMGDLRRTVSNLGYDHVKTYIQSGNCVFQSAKVQAKGIADGIAAGIKREFGFKPHVFALRLGELEVAIERNPYSKGHDDPKSVHLCFLSKPASKANTDALEELRVDSEAFSLTKRVFYLHAPDGIGRSKLAAKIEKHLAVPITARNLRSALKIAELAKMIDSES